MSRPAAPIPSPIAERSGEPPCDDLDAVLDRPLATALRVSGVPAVAGVLAFGLPERVRIDRTPDPEAASAAWQTAANGPDRRAGSPAEFGGCGWTGFGCGFGRDRVACVLVARASLDPANLAGLDAATLDIARVALLRDQVER